MVARSTVETFDLYLASCLPKYLQTAIFEVGLEPTYKGLKLEVHRVVGNPLWGLEPTYEGLKHVIRVGDLLGSSRLEQGTEYALVSKRVEALI